MGGKTKLRSKYPAAFKKCFSEAVQYGRCVSLSADLKSKECEKEFQQLNQCFKSAIKSLK